MSEEKELTISESMYDKMHHLSKSMSQVRYGQVDKTSEIIEIHDLISFILTKDEIADAFNEEKEVIFFLNDFSQRCIINLFSQYLIYGLGKEETKLNILKDYIQLFIKHMTNEKCLKLWDNVKEIFNPEKKIYDQERCSNDGLLKHLTYEEFNLQYFKRKNELQLHPNKHIDILVPFPDDNRNMKIWIRGIICNCFDESFSIKTGEPKGPYILKYNSLEYDEVGVHTQDWDFRRNLKENDIIDCFYLGKFYPATIKERTETVNKGVTYIVYKVGIKIYKKNVDDISKFQRFWKISEIRKDENGEEFVGFSFNSDQEFPFFSPYIQPPNSQIWKPRNNLNNHKGIEIPIEFSEPEKINGKKIITIGKPGKFKFFYNVLLDYFGELGGFEKMISIIKNENGELKKFPSEILFWLFKFLEIAKDYLYPQFGKEIAVVLINSIITYVNKLNNDELRNLKKDVIDIISSLLGKYMEFLTNDKMKINDEINKFSLNFAVRMLKSNFLDKRISAIKEFTDIIKTLNPDSHSIKTILNILEENQVLYEIFGPNSHIQLVNKCKELIGFLAENNYLTTEDLKIILKSTKTTYLEGKITTLKLLREISWKLNENLLHEIINSILSEINPNELIEDEISLIKEISLKLTNISIKEKCINFFFNSLGKYLNDSEFLSTIFCLAKDEPTLIKNVINKASKMLNNNDTIIFGFDILSNFYKYLKEDSPGSELYEHNFEEFFTLAKAEIQNNSNKKENESKENYSTRISTVLRFFKLLTLLKTWENKGENVVELVYTLLLNGEFDEEKQNVFFKWFSNLEKEDKKIHMIEFFRKNIVNNENSMKNLSPFGFKEFLHIFYHENQLRGLIKQTEKSRIVCIHPTNLIGFDVLWKLIFGTCSKIIFHSGIHNLHSLFLNTYLSDEDKANNNPMNFTNELISLCIKEIKEHSDECTKIENALNVINLLIKESEKFGTAGLTSHQGLHKGNLIIIKVTQNLGYIFNTPPFDMEIYLNTTIYDLKKEISQKVNCHFDFIKFIVNFSKPGGDNKMQQHELTLEENGETLFSMGFSNEIQIELRKNNLENSIPKALLIDNGTFTEEAFILFDGWYNYYSIEGQMTLEKCAEFVRDVTSSKEPVLPKDSRVTDLANGFDFIRREDFLQFYREKSMTCNELVFENINALGYRNDLKPFSEAYFQPITQPELLPRYQIAQDNEFFTFAFDLLQKEKIDNALNEKILKFINNLVTSPQIFNKILEHSNDNWKDIINDDNVFRMIYNFDIITYIIDVIDKNENDINQVKYAQWIEKFVITGGYKTLVNLFIEQLNTIGRENDSSINQKTNLVYYCKLIKLIKVFFLSAYDKSENEGLYTFLNNKQLGGKISDSFPKENLIVSLIGILLNLKEKNELELMVEIFDLLNPLICKMELTSSERAKLNDLESIIIFGIVIKNEIIRNNFSNSVKRIIVSFKNIEQYEILEKLFIFIIEKIKTHTYKEENQHNSIFEIFPLLISIYKEDPSKFTINFDVLTFVSKITLELIDSLKKEDTLINENLILHYLSLLSKLTEYDNEIKHYLGHSSGLLKIILDQFLFPNEVKVNIEQNNNSNTNNEKDVEGFKDLTSNSICNAKHPKQSLRQIFYNFVISNTKGDAINLIEILENILNVFQKFENELIDRDLNKENKLSNEKKTEGYVGLRNLGCICYMNSTIQQFFLIPSLRFSILSINDGLPQNPNEIYPNIDDNMFHQVQRMFSFLQLSERIDYNPFSFTFSFKDFDDEPTKLYEQKDAQEFLSFFLDKLENSIKQTPQKYMTQNIFGGKTCSQIQCKACNKVINRYEDSLFLSLEVKNMKNLNESLMKSLSIEEIEDYKCEGCNKKVTISKRNILARLPNVLICHLKRMGYDFDYDRNVKINSKLEFPRLLNMKQFTLEGCSNNIQETDEIYIKCNEYYEYYLTGIIVHVGSADAGHYYSYINTIRDGDGNIAKYDPKDEEMNTSWLEFNDSKITKFDVNQLETECFGGNNEKFDGPATRGMFGKEGGEKCKNAYMLIYERKIKNPMKIVINQNEINKEEKEIVTIANETQMNQIQKEYDVSRFYGKEEYNNKCSNLYKKIFFDEQKQEYFKYIPFYSSCQKLPIKYLNEIIQDNIELERRQNISDNYFTEFMEKLVNNISLSISSDKDEISQENKDKLTEQFVKFIIQIYIQKENTKLLIEITAQIVKICKNTPILGEKILNELYRGREIYFDYYLRNSSQRSLFAFTKLIKHIFKTFIENYGEKIKDIINKELQVKELLHEIEERDSPKEKTIESHKKDQKQLRNEVEIMKNISIAQQIVNIIESIIELFPNIHNKYIPNVSPFIHLLNDISELGNEFLDFLIKRSCIFKFVTFLLGNQALYYKQTFKDQEQEWDVGNRPIIQGQEKLCVLILSLVKRNQFLTNNFNIDYCTERDYSSLSHPPFTFFVEHHCSIQTRTEFSELLWKSQETDSFENE